MPRDLVVIVETTLKARLNQRRKRLRMESRRVREIAERIAKSIPTELDGDALVDEVAARVWQAEEDLARAA